MFLVSLFNITPYPFIFHRQLADIPVFQSLNIIVLQAGGITVLVSSPGHRTCELLSWISVHRPSVSFSHLTILLWNCWTDFNQTCHTCSLDGPLPDLCFWLPGPIACSDWLKLWKSSCQKPLNQLNCDFAGIWIVCRPEIQDGHHDSTWPYGKNV